MADEADPEELARRFLDLWQDQLTALAGDPELVEAMERWLSALGAGMPSAGQGRPPPWAMWPAAMMAAAAPAAFGAATDAGGAQRAWTGDDGTAVGNAEAAGDGGESAGSAARASGGTPGAAATAVAPGGGARDLDELHRRLAALEERIAALEAAARRGRRTPQRRPAKPRT